MRWLIRTSDLVNRATEIATAAALATICGVFLLEIYYRYILVSSLHWSLEVNRILFVWLVFLGIAIAWKHGEHIRFEYLFGVLPARAAGLLNGAVELLAVGFFAVVLWHGIELAQFAWATTFPSLRISRGWMYLALPVGAGLVLLHCAARLASGVALRPPEAPGEGAAP